MERHERRIDPPEEMARHLRLSEHMRQPSDGQYSKAG